MKYWILPAIMEWSYLIVAVFMCFNLGVYVWFTPDKPDPVFILGLGSLIIALMASGRSLATSERVKHHKRILQKAGLWTDEAIKKKDLPKD